MISFPTIIKGTLTGVRISAVDAGAFLDNCADVLPYVDGKSIIRLKDAAGKYNIAILGAPGTGETLGADVLSGWNLTNWQKDSSDMTIINSTTISTLSQRYIYKNLAVAGGLYLSSYNSSTTPGVWSAIASKSNLSGLVESGQSRRITVAGTAIFIFSNTGTTTVQSMSSQQVLTPSTTGCTLLNAAGAQSFISKDAAFTYNAASYTYEIFTTLRIANPRSIMGVNTFRN